ncbi:MAG: hypothetical protein KDD69_10795 [Bdellovibrionales bacterium]|nr:hypothetical protein [Bdellovibrionales bacterium]
MGKLLTNVFIFFLGMALAALFAFQRHFVSSEHSYAGSSVAVGAQLDTARHESARGRLAPEYQVVLAAQRDRAARRQAFSKEQRERILSEAVREGTLDSLQLVRSEYIGFLPEYRSELLPLLKGEALEELRTRFDQRDWLDWPSSSVTNQSNPTPAREFVDNVRLVNREIGRYLETAAQLFHGMYLNIMSGTPYSLKEDLFYILQNAETVLSNRRFPAIPARLYLEAAILDDPVFIQFAETLRRDLTLGYIEGHPRELKTHLLLINEVPPSLADSAVAVAVTKLLKKISLESSAAYRHQVFDLVLSSELIAALSQSDQAVRKALAEFYIIAAVDALEENDLERAKGMLRLSEDTLPELPAQQVVRRFIGEAHAAAKPTIVATAPAEEALPQTSSIFGKRSREGMAASLKTILIYLVLVGALGLVGMRLLVWQRSRRAVKERARVPDPMDDELHRPLDLTAPDSLHFEELGDDEQAPSTF